MDAETWKRVSAIAEQAIALTGQEREAFMERANREHPEIAVHLEAVVEAAANPDEFAEGLSESIGPILDSESFVRGEHFGPYKIAGTLGWGGMGAVYLAHRDDDQFEKTVALKVLPTLTGTSAARERFLRERQLLASLEHPSIARLLDGGVNDADQPYFALEYVRGKNAAQFADAEDTTLSEILAVFVQACDAVAFAHSRLVVHCDLKPSNVMVDDEGRARLIDFGISRLVTEQPFALDYLETPLTRNYASPELLEHGDIDTRSDIYSLGNLLYRLLTGRQRYQLEPTDDLGETLRAHPKIDVLPAMGNVTEVSPLARRELASVISFATALSRDERYQSVAQLRDDVERIRNGEAISAPLDAQAYRLRKLIGRNPLSSGLVALAAGAIIVALLVSLFSLHTAKQQRRAALAAETEARTAAQTSDAVVDFLVGAFGSAEPGNKDAESSSTARELVETGLRLAKENPPLADALAAGRLDLALGRAGIGVGAFAEAKEALIRASNAPLRSDEHRAAKLHLALAHGGLGEVDAFESQLGELLADCEAAKDNLCLVSAHRARGNWLSLASRNDEAAASYRSALTHLPAGSDGNSEERSLRAATLFNLGVTIHRSRRFDDANAIFEEAMAIHRDLGGPPTLESARAFTMLGNYKNARREFPEAKELLTKARDLRIRLHGNVHPEVAYVEFFLSRVVQELGENAAALELADSALAIRKARLGTENIYTSFSLARRADALGALGRLEEAEASLIAARAISETQRARSFAKQGFLLARVYRKQGKLNEAINVAEQALAIEEREFGDDHLVLARGLIVLASLFTDAGRPRDALVSLHRAQAISKPLRADHQRHPTLLLAIATAHRQLGALSDATQTIESAAQLASKVSPSSPTLVADVAEEQERIAGH